MRDGQRGLVFLSVDDCCRHSREIAVNQTGPGAGALIQRRRRAARLTPCGPLANSVDPARKQRHRGGIGSGINTGSGSARLAGNHLLRRSLWSCESS
jgi:hypothetical protein